MFVITLFGKNKKLIYFFITLLFISCNKEEKKDSNTLGFTSPTAQTIQKNKNILKQLSFEDKQDFLDANRGFIAKSSEMQVHHKNAQRVVWDLPEYNFINGDAPSSVNPSLWRQEKLNNIHGIFKVTEGIYQLRGYDLSNMTIIEGNKGWIIVDPLTSIETAEKAMAFFQKHLGDKPITAIIFTHSHIDHFGGVLGLGDSLNIPIIAPQGFMQEATSENIMTGMSMWRRSLYMFGELLPRSDRGHIGSGLGKNPAFGTFSILEPTEFISKTGQQMDIDGVQFVFQLALDSEAPSELTFYLPEKKAFCGAEILSRTMHNLYTLRGAKVRDASKWSQYIDEAMTLFGDMKVYFGSHHWPMWGNERILEFMQNQRDTYKYIHDQTIRMANNGSTPSEIAENIKLPKSLESKFFNRGYYGNIKQNAKAVYQYYFGWYDGNPAQLDPLPPVHIAKKYVDFMGGESSLMTKAKVSYDDGEYRWVAEVLNHLVFANPNNKNARELLAKSYDQLGYQAEAGPWRDNYLSGAFELRHGSIEKGFDIADMAGIFKHTPVSEFFNSMAVRLNGPKAEGKKVIVNVIFSDINESYTLTIENAVLHHRQASPISSANATLKITHELFLRMVMKQVSIKETLFSDDLEVDGSVLDLVQFFGLFDNPTGKFNLVTP
ncbi:MAG: MBL fold metallo-hydrolase [Candidatus Marinimicrobia bacterium]|nr:MBL fold metallo-hydrolase [Candidatus Neomarinimicrobiota bacterium]MBL7009700.1 MBL fold metallo-hydrolase [Candidatus Neomarinimicrobiota bacterium]MBL7029557.1 MBL fold metallo-hydrolase [Candidatus Neomarinimicrobiota bacterium]